MLLANSRPTRALLLGTNPLNDLRSLPGLAAFYDAYDQNSIVRDSVGRVSQWNDLTGRARHLAQGTAASQPIYLPWSGQNYGYCPGVAGNYFSTPDSAAVSVTGDIDLRMKMALDSWAPASNQILISKLRTDGQSSFDVFINNSGTGTIVFRRTATGAFAGIVPYNSTAGSGFAAGATGWLRVTYASSSGTATFYSSTDGSTWNQLGAPVVSTTGGIFDGTDLVAAGECSGKFFYAEIRNGIGGTVVAAFDPSRAADGATSFVAATGETWTVNSSGGKPAQIVGRSSVMFDGVDDFIQATFSASQPLSAYFVLKQNAWTVNRVLADANSQLAQMTASPTIGVPGGAGNVTTSNLAVGSTGVVALAWNGSSSLIQINRGLITNGTGPSASFTVFTIGASTAGSQLSNTQVSSAAIFAAAHDTRTRARVIDYLIRKYGINA